LGKVRTEKVKGAARELVERFPSRFTVNFESNKEAVDALTRISSKKLRNQVAGYITRLIATTQPSEESDTTEEEIEEPTE
jgi:small subunit ribosomal protein S17e